MCNDSTFDTIDVLSSIRKILTLSQHSTYTSGMPITLYIEDKTKFRKQNVSLPRYSTHALSQDTHIFCMSLFSVCRIDIKFYTTRSADQREHPRMI